jgi:hypothetical protein
VIGAYGLGRFCTWIMMEIVLGKVPQVYGGLSEQLF